MGDSRCRDPDNLRWGKRVMTTSLPDLVIDDFTINATSFVAGSYIGYSGIIGNDGNATAGAFNTTVYLSTAENINYTISSNYYTTTSLATTQQANFSGSILISNGLASGQYYIGVQADSSNQVAESNENNNLAWLPITVTGISTPTTYSFSPNPATVNENG